jgi:prepilin-type N-terminal cleavage/methylation domain-containing protein
MLTKQIRSFSQKVFTLIELLVVIAIIASLAVIVFNAINPGKRIKEAQHKTRIQNATTILDALHTYIVDSLGALPDVIGKIAVPGTYSAGNLNEVQIGSATNGCAISTGGCSSIISTCINLANPGSATSGNMVGSGGIGAYMSSNPIDTAIGDSARTGYTLSVTNGIATIKSCNSANSPNITVSR